MNLEDTDPLEGLRPSPKADARIIEAWRRAIEANVAGPQDAKGRDGMRVMLREIDRLRAQVAGLEKERDHWKANHDHQLSITRDALRERVVAAWRKTGLGDESPVTADDIDGMISGLEFENARLRERVAALESRELDAGVRISTLVADNEILIEQLAAARRKFDFAQAREERLRYAANGLLAGVRESRLPPRSANGGRG